MDIDSFDFDTLNPGKELRNYLMLLIPKGDLNVSDALTNGFTDRIDYIFKHNGEYQSLVYMSAINFLLRKIIKSAHYYKKKSELTDDYNYIDETRKYLTENSRFNEDEIEKILSLTILTISYFENKPSKGLRNSLIRDAKASSTPCYMCGRPINYDDRSSYEFVQVEHVWPKGIGGSNREFNLKVACFKCNKVKEEFIDYSDFHYEHISYKSLIEDYPLHEEFKYGHKLAIWGKNEFKCIVCSQEAVNVGPLKFKRRNPDDTWHFLNIDAYCNDHYNV